jgi:hypothetical protein
MKNFRNFSISIFLILIFLGISKLQFAQKTLSYQRIINGLDQPDFDEGATDFVFDDINMDGNLDILSVGDHGSPNFNTAQHGILVWFGDGQGNFQNYMNGNFGYGGIAAGDVNNDGFKDVGFGVHHNYSSTNFGDQLIEVALGDGTGMNWQPYDAGLATNGETWGMFGTAFADFDNNGLLDLVSISFGCCAGLHVYLNQGDGSWQQSFGFTGGGSGFLVRTCDINNDGFMDFISSHQNGTAYFGDGTGNFENNDTGLPGAGSTARAGLDVARINTTESAGFSYINSSGGVKVFAWDNLLEKWTDLSGNLPATGIYQLSQIADMNNDGFADVMAYGNLHFQLWLGDDSGNWIADAAFTTNDDPGDGNAMRTDGDLDKNGFPDLLILTTELTGSWIQVNKNIVYAYLENSPADELWIKPLFPNGNEHFYPGTAQFIEWATEVPAGTNSTAKIELSAFGPDGPWWLLADNLPNNGKHQWIVPETGSENIFLKFTISDGFIEETAITAAPFTIFGSPTSISRSKFQGNNNLLYPNPGNDWIEISDSRNIKRFCLFSLDGQCLIDQQNPSFPINTKNLNGGLYHFKIWFNDGSDGAGKWVKILN